MDVFDRIGDEDYEQVVFCHEDVLRRVTTATAAEHMAERRLEEVGQVQLTRPSAPRPARAG